MKTLKILAVCLGFILLGGFSSNDWAEENVIPNDQIGNAKIMGQADAPILLAKDTRPTQRQPKAKIPDIGGGGGCMSKYSQYYSYQRNPSGFTGDTLPLVPLSSGCQQCLNRNAEWGNSFSQASLNCYSACCQ